MDFIGIIFQIIGMFTSFIDLYGILGIVGLAVATMIVFIIFQAAFEASDKLLKMGMIVAVIVFIVAFLYYIGFSETVQQTYTELWNNILTALHLK